MAHVRAMLNRFRDESDDEGGDQQQHFPAAELDTSVPCRNPLDPAPYPEAEIDAGGDESFPSLFLPVVDGASGGKDESMADAELRHSWHQLQGLIAKCLDTDSTPADTVEMVHTFYTERIRANFTDAPEWSRKSIYQHIYRNYERQAAEAIHAVNHTMEFLRTQMAVKREDGTVKINAENVKLFLAATKAHASLVDAKRKREQR